MNLPDDLDPYTFGPSGFKKDLTDTITIPRYEYEAMKRRIAQLERRDCHNSWLVNPDRMGS